MARIQKVLYIRKWVETGRKTLLRKKIRKEGKERKEIRKKGGREKGREGESMGKRKEEWEKSRKNANFIRYF